MASSKSIKIIGGGLAGLTLGIGLRQRGVPAMIHEAGRYPRHRVCGEFISGRGQATLARLGLSELVQNAGAASAQTIAFYSATKSSLPRPLPSPAICLSRFALDAALARKFCELGGEMVEGSRIMSTEMIGEGVICSTGRRLPEEQGRARWFGLKIHARNVRLAADLEMHVSPRGYVGLCKINNGEINICGLFRKRVGENGGNQEARLLLHGPTDSPLNERLKMAQFDENSFCAIAGLSLQPQLATEHAEICVGDAITMIPPVTGNGMSMAFESAELAIEPLSRWSRGEISWIVAREKIAQDCDIAFARRLAWAKWLQRLILTPALQNPLIALTSRGEWLWRMAFEYTR